MACFVIAPIGAEGSAARERSDTIFEHLIRPVVERCGCTPVLRADHIDSAGLITTQIITHLVQDALVVADLTDHNPNVFYELAIRHATRKPVVHLIQQGQSLPFDTAAQRVITFNLSDWGDLKRCSQALEAQVKSVLADPASADNPISVAVQLDALRTSDVARDRQMGELLTRLNHALLHASQAQMLSLPMRAVAASLKADLRNLISAEVSYFADNVRYTTNLADLQYSPSRDNDVTILGATGTGFWAVARHVPSAVEYGIYVGEAPPEVAVHAEGAPFLVNAPLL